MELSIALIQRRIYLVRGLQVVLDSDLAELYQTKTKVLNQAVRRNPERFPPDFMPRLSAVEYAEISKKKDLDGSTQNYGGRRHLPYGFTQEGVSMLSSVLNSERAVQVNILVMRAFVQLRQVSEAHLDLVKRFDQFEKNCLEQFQAMATVSQRPPEHLKPIEVESKTVMNPTYAKIGAIQNVVAHYYKIRAADLKSAARSAEVALPRQVCMYLLRKHLKLSYKRIGIALGGRDHTTVLHACYKIENEADVEITGALEVIESLLAA